MGTNAAYEPAAPIFMIPLFSPGMFLLAIQLNPITYKNPVIYKDSLPPQKTSKFVK